MVGFAAAPDPIFLLESRGKSVDEVGMRILRLDLGEGTGTIDLHPYISVLHDLRADQVRLLQDSIRSLVSGSGDGVLGLVERGGQLVELSTEIDATVGPMTTEDIIVAVDELAPTASDPVALTSELDQIRRRAAIDAVYVEEIRADLTPSAAGTVQRLRDALGLNSTSADAEKVAAREEIRELLDASMAIPAVLREVPPAVQDLMEDWYAYEEHREEVLAHLEDLTTRVHQAEAHLRTAQQRHQAARAEAVPRQLTPEQEARLEELAASSLDRRGRRSKRQTPEAEAEMSAILSTVDVATYTGYAMYRLNPSAAPDKVALVEAAALAVDGARAELDQARGEVTTDPVAVELATRFDEVKDKAREHLGPMLPTDLGAALSELVVERDNPDWFEGIRQLYEQFRHVGADLPSDLQPRDLPGWVGHWLQEQDDEAAKDAIDTDETRLQLAEAEQALDRHARAMGRIDRLEVSADASAARVSAVENQIARIEAGEQATAEGILGALSPLVQRIEAENVESVPIVLVGDFPGLEEDEVDLLMGELELFSKQHQLILMTNRRRAATWASGVGLGRALRGTAEAA